MINARVKLSWAPSAVTAAIRREVKAAVRKGGERVARETKIALNVSGKSNPNRAGMNRGTVVQRFNRVDQSLLNRGQVSTMTAKGSLKTIVTGSYQFRGTQNKKRIYRIDRVYWYGSPLFRWVQSSVPGTPPHKQTGELQRRIAVQPINEGYRTKVGPSQGLKYARIQELGGKGLLNLPPRPYLQPSFQKMIPAIMQDFRVAIAKATS